MSNEFAKFPHTPHLASLSKSPVRGDRVLSETQAASLLEAKVVIEEKIDGANLGISISPEGRLLVQNRGNYLEYPASLQFRPLWNWLKFRSDRLESGLGPNLVLFGEWCYAVHSIRYDRLPDWFVGFDILDRVSGRFLSSKRRNLLLANLQISVVPQIGVGRFSMKQLRSLLEQTSSAYGVSPIEGLYLRRESEEWLEQRVKLVGPEFTQAISGHWSSRPIEPNTTLQNSLFT